MRHFIPFVLALAPLVVAVDRNNFKTCKDSSFCERRRKFEGEGEKYKGKSSNTIYFILKFVHYCTFVQFRMSHFLQSTNVIPIYYRLRNTDHEISIELYRLRNIDYVSPIYVMFLKIFESNKFKS